MSTTTEDRYAFLSLLVTNSTKMLVALAHVAMDLFAIVLIVLYLTGHLAVRYIP